MTVERVASLAPSATSTLTAMGADDLLVGVTRHCDHDAEAVGGWLAPDLDRVDALAPDLVCTADALQADVRDELVARGHETLHVEPDTLDAVLDCISTVGDAVGRPEAAAALVRSSRERLDRVRERVAERDRPVVYCEEWSDPPMAAGNWVPDAVRVAGGRYPFVAPGERSTEVDASAVEAVAPEHVVLHVCGRGDRVDPATVTDRGWSIPAVERGAVHVVDDSLLNQPSPLLVDGVEQLARRLHPDAFP